ncbi:MAG: LytTR family transcriptional regulator [Oscillibacter sp.]|jgi:hypothetical protein|nr:LytTR family transcriptional regulator [Oscillibacter sp.]
MQNDLEAITVKLVEEYYNNCPQMFFDYMHDDIVWIGPGIHQYICGKRNLVSAFSKEENTLSFRTSQMLSKTVKGGNNNTCEVLLRFVVYTYYSDGSMLTHYQRVTFFWRKCRINGELTWRYSLIHISNGMETDSRDHIYPLHFNEFEQKRFHHNFTNLAMQQKERLIARGFDACTYYIEYADISHICAGKGKLCYIHTRNGVICVRLLLDQLIKQLPKEFYRPHRSYIINVLEIVKLTRNQIQLKNDASIPIPPKKHNQVEADIAEILREKTK